MKSAEDVNKPRMQVVDMVGKQQIADIDLFAAGLSIEPELIDFENGVLYYMDASGAAYTFEFI